jgi:hypothetical protein
LCWPCWGNLLVVVQVSKIEGQFPLSSGSSEKESSLKLRPTGITGLPGQYYRLDCRLKLKNPHLKAINSHYVFSCRNNVNHKFNSNKM